MTLPVILAYARGTEDERQFWRDAVAGFANSDEDLAQAVEIIHKHNAVADTRERARLYAQRACDALAIFPDSEARRAMVEAAQFAVTRGY
jgi:octaprenyl-diphosphate synthase